LAAVHRCVVDLHDQGVLAALQTIYHHGLPQGPVALETLACELADKVGQLAHATRRPKRHMYEVIVEIESRVLDPMGIADL
jgi:hypothetical protein